MNIKLLYAKVFIKNATFYEKCYICEKCFILGATAKPKVTVISVF